MKRFVAKQLELRNALWLFLWAGLFGVASASTICTQQEFEATLADMIGTGGQYLEVFPVNLPQFPAAFMQAEQTLSPATQSTFAPFKGIYVVSNNLRGPDSILPDAVYSNSSVNGVVIIGLWNHIEMSPGVFDWSVVDLEITRALQHGKKIAVSITAGAYAPEWLYSAPYNVPHSTFLWANHDGRGGACEPYTLPVPWAPQYEQAWRRLMQTLATHLREIPGAYAATTRIKLTGINTLTDELHLAFCSSSNGLAIWQRLGYTPRSLFSAAKSLMLATSEAFPDKILSLSVIEAGGLPRINDAGEAVGPRDPSYVDVKQQLIDYALSNISGIKNRFAVQWNGFQTAQGAAQSVIAAGDRGAIIGWETNEFGGLATGAECL